MSECRNVWALVLAAGDGRRLRGLTTTRLGRSIPKQFCCLESGPSLLHEALHRAEAVASPERICTIVAAQHRQWWATQLDAAQPANIIIQPENRGTAIGILLPLLTILERDPGARIVILPSDHHVRDEEKLARSLEEAAAPPDDAWAEIILLGLEPRAPDPELGYIVPHRGTHLHHQGVERFVEKPTAQTAASLLKDGALWNAFIIAADAYALLALFERRCPEIVVAMRDCLQSARLDDQDGGALAELYEQLPVLDLSRNILQGEEARLRVLRVPECGWNDLGTPERVAAALQAVQRTRQRLSEGPVAGSAFLSLASQHRRLASQHAAAG